MMGNACGKRLFCRLKRRIRAHWRIPVPYGTPLFYIARIKQQKDNMMAGTNCAFCSFFAISLDFAILGVASRQACNCGQNLFADFILG